MKVVARVLWSNGNFLLYFGQVPVPAASPKNGYSIQRERARARTLSLILSHCYTVIRTPSWPCPYTDVRHSVSLCQRSRPQRKLLPAVSFEFNFELRKRVSRQVNFEYTHNNNNNNKAKASLVFTLISQELFWAQHKNNAKFRLASLAASQGYISNCQCLCLCLCVRV